MPHAHIGSAEGVVRKYVKVIKESWTASACEMEVSLVPGDYDPLLAELQNVTKGDFTFEVEGNFGAVVAEPEAPAKKGKGKGKKRR